MSDNDLPPPMTGGYDLTKLPAGLHEWDSVNFGRSSEYSDKYDVYLWQNTPRRAHTIAVRVTYQEADRIGKEVHRLVVAAHKLRGTKLAQNHIAFHQGSGTWRL